MLITLLLLIGLLSLPAAIWLIRRLWMVSPIGALLTAILLFPGLYWGYLYWNDEQAKLKIPLILNGICQLMLVVLGMQVTRHDINAFIYGEQYLTAQAQTAVQSDKNPDMTRWCNEEHDGAFDRQLGTCVERPKQQMANEESGIVNKLAAHMARHGLNIEVNINDTALHQQLKTAPQIAEAASLYFLPFSMQQAQITLLLCVSTSACSDYEISHQTSTQQILRNRHLLLLIPTSANKDTAISQLSKWFITFRY
jgi:hypothetical protein